MKKTTTFEAGIGYSIELEINIDWRLKLRGKYEGSPLYESIGGKVTAIAMVEKPVIKTKAIANENYRTITGPIMIPDQKTFRTLWAYGKENCYWYFSAETTQKLQEEIDGEIKLGH